MSRPRRSQNDEGRPALAGGGPLQRGDSDMIQRRSLSYQELTFPQVQITRVRCEPLEGRDQQLGCFSKLHSRIRSCLHPNLSMHCQHAASKNQKMNKRWALNVYQLHDCGDSFERRQFFQSISIHSPIRFLGQILKTQLSQLFRTFPKPPKPDLPCPVPCP